MADQTPSAPRVGFAKSLLFSLIATALFLGALEGGAMILEPRYFPYKRSLPIPAPNAPGNFEFGAQAEQVRRSMDPNERPTFQHMEIPLVGDSVRRWALPANSEITVGGVGVRVNSMGMRGADVELIEGDVRLFTLGDSSIFGDGLKEPDVFSTVTAGLLAKSWGRKVTGIIGAVPGHDSVQSLATLKHFGPQLQPTWVVVGNLWSDVYKQEVSQVAEAYTYLPPVKGVLRNSALYRILWRFASPWLNAQQVRWIEGRQDVGTDVDAGTRVPLRQYLSNLRALVQTSRQMGARVAFLTLPAPMDFDELPVPDTVQRYRFAQQQVAKETGCPILDGPALYKARGANIGYFADQVHPNADGHMLLGIGLAELLEPEGAPPQGSSHYLGYEVDPDVKAIALDPSTFYKADLNNPSTGGPPGAGGGAQ